MVDPISESLWEGRGDSAADYPSFEEVASLRVSLGRLLIADAIVGLVGLLMAFSGGSIGHHGLSLACIFAVFFVMHAAVVPLRGLAFVIYDEPPDSPFKYYFFAAIGAAVFLGETAAYYLWPVMSGG